ncbi:MAG: hypothetical protein VR65_06030 [Desulfobulbaceae bacterium BRH_c16a]|nr:MAG: hypothetical protein VR65_06030 [Desulfobulbaceae bacterium BRH_c16a]
MNIGYILFYYLLNSYITPNPSNNEKIRGKGCREILNQNGGHHQPGYRICEIGDESQECLQLKTTFYRY